jgi:hypothetical protein
MVSDELCRISDAMQEIPDLTFPRIEAREYPTLELLIDVYDRTIKEARNTNNPGPITGLDKIKTFFGGK